MLRLAMVVDGEPALFPFRSGDTVAAATPRTATRVPAVVVDEILRSAPAGWWIRGRRPHPDGRLGSLCTYLVPRHLAPTIDTIARHLQEHHGMGYGVDYLHTVAGDPFWWLIWHEQAHNATVDHFHADRVDWTST